MEKDQGSAASVRAEPLADLREHLQDALVDDHALDELIRHGLGLDPEANGKMLDRIRAIVASEATESERDGEGEEGEEIER